MDEMDFTKAGFVVVTDTIPANTGEDLSDALQADCAKLEADLAAIPVGSIMAMNYCHEVLIPDMAEARKAADQLETLTASKSWPFPVYSDLLFSV
mgnify:CR=1 FL=1